MKLVCDVTSTKKLEQCIDNVANNFGPLAILINNAGIYKTNFFAKEKYNPTIFKKLINVNLTSVIDCCGFAVPYCFGSLKR